MITYKQATHIKDLADGVKDNIANRDIAIRDALTAGAKVAELVALTGLTRARIYQIRDGK